MKQTKLTHRPGSHKISKLLCIAGVAAAGMTLGIAPASATITCTGSGNSPETPFSAVAGKAEFTLNTAVSPKTLTLVLTNSLSTPTLNPASTLTGVIFNIGANSAVLSYSATTNPVLGPGSHTWVNGTTINDATLLSNASGSSWTNQKAANPPVAFGYGVATTGFAGFFNGGSIAVGNANPNHAIVAANTFPGSIGGSQFPWIQNSLQFVFTTTSTFTEADISSVGFLYGTAGGAPVTSTCTLPKDYGDAPDAGTSPSTGPGNYQTTAADGGPNHLLGTNVYLGAVAPDADNGTLQDAAASADNTTGTNDEDGIPVLPAIFTSPPSVNMTVKATNRSGSDAYLACWIDFNRDGDFLDAGEMGGPPVPFSSLGPVQQTFNLTFTGYTATAGDAYIRCRVASVQSEVASSIGDAASGEVEDYRVTITAGGGGDIPYADFGDAPDTGPGTGPGNYVTTDAGSGGDLGPNHLSTPQIYLGTLFADDDNGTLQNTAATADDDNNTDDEDGIPLEQIPTFTTTSTSSKMSVTATNNTGGPAYLACWIDYNRNGSFENTNELATALIPDGTNNVAFPLSYTHPALGTTGVTYIRCRITNDWTSAGQVTSVGTAGFGEVEDFQAKIVEPCVTSAITPVPGDPLIPQTYLSGITFTVTPGAPLTNIASVQCKKMINILPAGISFSPGNTSGPGSAPYTWGFSPALNVPVTITARRAAAGSATLACTVQDTVGNECAVDPVIVETLRVKGQPVTISVLDDGKPLSVDFQYVKIQNGSPTEEGLTQVEISVNGKKFKQTAMKTNTAYFLNIGSALRSDV